MSACFLFVSHPRGAPSHPLSALEPLCPFLPEREDTYAHPSGAATGVVWSARLAGARGGYLAASPRGDEAVGFTGWWREPSDAPLDATVAQNLLRALTRDPRDPTPALEALHLGAGQLAAVLIAHDGALHGVAGVFCGRHLFYGVKRAPGGDEVALSNRASLVAAYLHGGALPRPRLESLAWLLARHESPLGDPSAAWEGVRHILPGERLEARAGAAALKAIPLPAPEPLPAQGAARVWDELHEALTWRAGQLTRLPGVRFELALTGGLDSRLVLGALLSAGVLSAVTRVHLTAVESHHDARSARLIADAYGLDLEVTPPLGADAPQESFLPRARRHNFLTELLVNAWDLKDGGEALALREAGVLPGHCGELYRSHALPLLSRSSALLRAVYHTHAYMDRHRLLTPELLDACVARGGEWLRAQQARDPRPSFTLDALHRAARMERWVSQTQQWEGLGGPSVCLLPCARARAVYDALPLADRVAPRVHFELMRRVDGALWRLPFGTHRWPARFYESLGLPAPGAPTGGGGNELGYQMRLWAQEGAALCAWMLDAPAHSPFWELVSRPKLLKKAARTLRAPHPQPVKGLLAAAALKVALEEPLTPARLRPAPGAQRAAQSSAPAP